MSIYAQKFSSEEVMGSLTGFDEIAIEKHMNIDVYTDGERKPIVLMRALVFVLLRRDGQSDTDAKQTVQGMSVKAVQELFEDDDEANPEDPDTDSGKDVSPPPGQPTD